MAEQPEQGQQGRPGETHKEKVSLVQVFTVISPKGTYKSGRTPAPRWSPNEVSSHALKNSSSTSTVTVKH